MTKNKRIIGALIAGVVLACTGAGAGIASTVKAAPAQAVTSNDKAAPRSGWQLVEKSFDVGRRDLVADVQCGRGSVAVSGGFDVPGGVNVRAMVPLSGRDSDSVHFVVTSSGRHQRDASVTLYAACSSRSRP